MDPTVDPASDGINEVPDLMPVSLPGRDIVPTTEERLDTIESILKIN